MDSAQPQQINNLLRQGVVTTVDQARALCRV
ncbi:phage baseplate assembly protein V, partial [Corallococcus sp. AB049A]